MWNSGMMLRPRSLAVKPSEARMLAAEAQTLDCFSGTILGRDVVPDVCSTSAMSSGCAGPEFAAFLTASPSGKASVKLPAPLSGVGCSRATGTCSFSATAMAGEVAPSATTSSLALRSSM